ncbi:hypothetical protein [Ferruginibacter sp.]
MERNFYTDNFEQLLKEKSDEFRMYPSKRVWHSIYNDLHPGRKWPSVAVSMMMVIILLLGGYWNNNATDKTIAAKQNIAPAGNSTASSNIIPAFNLNTAVAFNSKQSSAVATHIPGNHNDVNGRSATSVMLNRPATNKITVTIPGSITDPAVDGTESNNAVAGSDLPATAPANAIAPGDPVTAFIIPSSVFSLQAQDNKNSSSQTTAAVTGQDKNDITYLPSTVSPAADQKFNTTSFSGINNLDPAVTAKAAIQNKNSNTGSVNTNTTPDKAVAKNTNVPNRPVNKTATTSAINKTGGVADVAAGFADAQKTTGSNADADKDQQATDIAGTDKNSTTATTQQKENTTDASLTSNGKKIMTADDKAWIENYAFQNRSKRKKWQDRTAFNIYITPNVGYRHISNDPKYNLSAATPSNSFVFAGGGDASSAMDHKPGLGFEMGVGLNYSLAKNLVVKGGLQVNFTSYGINAEVTNHPVQSSLMLIDPNTGFPNLHATSSSLANGSNGISGNDKITVYSTTYQLSVPLGFALKISGNNKLEWYAGATVQPSFIMGGKDYLISADRKNYIEDHSLLSKWNMNAGFETYLNYKLDAFTLQFGPQFRYQLMSTYYRRYTVNENLYNVGIKFGILKNF